MGPFDQTDGMHTIRLVDVSLPTGNRFMVTRPQTPPPLTFAGLCDATGLPVNLEIHCSLLAIADDGRSVICKTRVDEDFLQQGLSMSGDVSQIQP
jgi:hypothetical protein